MSPSGIRKPLVRHELNRTGAGYPALHAWLRRPAARDQRRRQEPDQDAGAEGVLRGGRASGTSSTYIQSGNVLFASDETRSAELARPDRGDARRRRSATRRASCVRSRTQMRAIVERAPEGFGSEPARYRYDVIFLKPPLTARGRAEERAHEARASTRLTPGPACSTSRRLISKAVAEPAQQDRLLADLPEHDHPQLEHDDEAAADG